MNNYYFGNYIRELREKKGLSQSQLGEQLGVTNKAVSRWENGSAYPSTELMLPLAKELGITIEELYKVISEDKTPKTKLRIFLEHLTRHSKIITAVCAVLVLVPYILFVCFSNIEEKNSLMIVAPIATVFMGTSAPIALYLVLFKNPFASARIAELFSTFFLAILSISYIPLLWDFIFYFPNGFSLTVCMLPMMIMTITLILKKKYK